MLIRFFIICFSLFAISRVGFRYKNDEIALRELILWILFWGISIIVGIIPNSTNLVAKVFGVGRGADLVVYFSLIMLFYIVFKLLGRVYRLERDITKLTRYLALRDIEKK